ncbi:hypothetical protein M9H77_34426 [Catharanthus roseus]|uniref:Uncharacterized protein n=1 Tax=Catharanthus roseus TaxID=4058 RepID=A0ACB9ZMC9_CATRO|nr:hypothetical protein M9H77_34426 [Catharanthus roseus]
MYNITKDYMIREYMETTYSRQNMGSMRKQEGFHTKFSRDKRNFYCGGGNGDNTYSGNKHGNGNFTPKGHNGDGSFSFYAKSYKHNSYDDYGRYGKVNVKYVEHSPYDCYKESQDIYDFRGHMKSMEPSIVKEVPKVKQFPHAKLEVEEGVGTHVEKENSNEDSCKFMSEKNSEKEKYIEIQARMKEDSFPTRDEELQESIIRVRERRIKEKDDKAAHGLMIEIERNNEGRFKLEEEETKRSEEQSLPLYLPSTLIMQELQHMRKEIGDTGRDMTNLSMEQRGRSNIGGHVTPHTQRGYGSYNSHVPYETPVQSTHQFYMVVDKPTLEMVGMED